MKPLDLTVYPRLLHVGHESGDRFFACDACSGLPAAQSVAKYFTDAELAAEHWLACWAWERSVANNDGYDGDPHTRLMRQRAETFLRFATLPHSQESF